MGYVKISKQTWSCLFFHVWRFPGLGVVGNKFGTKHVNVSALSNCLYLMHETFFSWLFQNWTPQKWVSSWRIPCTLCASWATVPFDSAHLSPILLILSLSLCLTFSECSSVSFPLSKWSHCLMPPYFIPEAELELSVVTADVDRSPESLLNQTQAPATLDWAGLPHLERGGPEPWGAPSHVNTPLICCEHLVVNKGSWIFPRAKERSAEGFCGVSLKHRLQTDPLWERAVLGYFQSRHIPVFIPSSCGANCASGNSRSWEGLVRVEPWSAFSTISEKFPWLSVWGDMVGNKISDSGCWN